MSSVTPLRPPMPWLDKALGDLTAEAKDYGRQARDAEIRRHGIPAAIASDVSVVELIRALNTAGLSISTMDGLVVIHRLIPSAA